jgi:hypothetical protein
MAGYSSIDMVLKQSSFAYVPGVLCGVLKTLVLAEYEKELRALEEEFRAL